ncbi:hypothetical protein AB0C77_02910 [Streptomyces sp. NPDC048629]|uniref:hypothetical protein n=1 Tax=Streptomyces sp. NPDC048629 TaxID=3154824 RepID=UPI003440E2AD
MGTARRGASVDAVQNAKSARDELREALEEVDIVLPSLGIDAVTLAAPYVIPLVELGRCRPEVARRLASLVRGDASGTDGAQRQARDVFDPVDGGVG